MEKGKGKRDRDGRVRRGGGVRSRDGMVSEMCVGADGVDGR